MVPRWVAIPATVKGWNPKRDTNIEIKIVTVSGPRKWPDNTKVWKLIENPTDANQSIWLSSDGQVRWDTPDDT